LSGDEPAEAPADGGVEAIVAVGGDVDIGRRDGGDVGERGEPEVVEDEGRESRLEAAADVGAAADGAQDAVVGGVDGRAAAPPPVAAVARVDGCVGVPAHRVGDRVAAGLEEEVPQALVGDVAGLRGPDAHGGHEDELSVEEGLHVLRRHGLLDRWFEERWHERIAVEPGFAVEGGEEPARRVQGVVPLVDGETRLEGQLVDRITEGRDLAAPGQLAQLLAAVDRLEAGEHPAPPLARVGEIREIVTERPGEVAAALVEVPL
jgi:hypothetical protein